MNFYNNALVLVPLLGTISFASGTEEKRPNILFAIADDMSYGHTSYNGFPEVKTPAYDRIAREGIVFTRAYVSAPSCTPSRGSILTGRNAYELEEGGVLWSFLPEKFQVYPEILKQHGYYTGCTGKGWGPGELAIANRADNPAGKSFGSQKREPILAQGKVSGISNNDYAANFKQFLNGKRKDQPFCFWFGSIEPHRDYQDGSGKRDGKNPSRVSVPDFLPGTDEVRNDILDYLLEIEWYDSHLLKMLSHLDSIGELENTIVVFTSDNGMPFPRAKANLYEYGTHMPLAIRWGKKAPRVVTDFISFADFAPTLLEAARIPIPESMSGKSFLDILKSIQSGQIDQSRNNVIMFKERHAWSQPNNECTPVRAYRKDDWLLIWNIFPEMWPAGHSDPENNASLWPFGDCDDGPSKLEVMKLKNTHGKIDYFNLSFGRRPEFELYDIKNDPYQLRNLALDHNYKERLSSLLEEMKAKLDVTNDPRITGTGVDKFQKAPYFSPNSLEKLDLMSEEERNKFVRETHEKLEKNIQRLKEIYGE